MRAMILGGAECVWEDVAALERMIGREWGGLVIAANDIGSHWPRRLDAWVSLHPNKFKKWIAARQRRGHPDGFTTYVKRGSGQRYGEVVVTHKFGGGASGLLAVTVALHLGCTKVVLCGVPMEKIPHFAESEVHVKGRPWSNVDAHRRKWRDHGAELAGIVKSMSMVYDSKTKKWRPSWTRQLLGAPTPEWLEGDNEQAA